MLSLRYLLVPGFLLAAVLLLLANEYAVGRGSHRTRDIAYQSASAPGFDAERHLLDVYAPRHKAGPRPVVVFIHGGSWNSGNKNFYSFIGRRLARQGVVAVVVNYRLSPSVQVPAMAEDCARAVQWVSQNIGSYGGDPQRIFLLGHSAGGGLAALLATDSRQFARLGLSTNPVQGVILNDAAGLDMHAYLQKQEYPGDADYLIPYGKDPAVWKAMSPIYHVSAQAPPFLIFVGENTYPSITSSTARFRQKLIDTGFAPQFEVLPGKKHAAMVLQLFWSRNVIYQRLLPFVGAEPKSTARK
ncbi:alpha/beta hydrolase [Hymenobacter sp. BT175]|uniref:alpha/beta hydrolase n=1 Tax=Hymenobacter translucens TaxID=2886507 RepID=UPI001D0E89C0|nr:alpha/beta hydrolase [Hymenobacter translucens]MCC2548873.1 alpha/beta hydrolase [Hymenobacter translucens]